jgi:hypothetical protein
MVSPKAGSVVLDGKDIHRYSTKEIARRLSLLPQSALVPSQITVGDLVARGRFPHQSIFRRWSVEDEHVVAEAMTLTGVADIAHRYVDELSGGQRQRAWLAMVRRAPAGSRADARRRPARPQPVVPVRHAPGRHERRRDRGDRTPGGRRLGPAGGRRLRPALHRRTRPRDRHPHDHPFGPSGPNNTIAVEAPVDGRSP